MEPSGVGPKSDQRILADAPLLPRQAFWTFRHQRVFDPVSRAVIHLHPLPPELSDRPPEELGVRTCRVVSSFPRSHNISSWAHPLSVSSQSARLTVQRFDVWLSCPSQYLGAALDPVVAMGIADGDIDPLTFERFEGQSVTKADTHPGRKTPSRSALKTHSPNAPATTGPYCSPGDCQADDARSVCGARSRPQGRGEGSGKGGSQIRRVALCCWSRRRSPACFLRPEAGPPLLECFPDLPTRTAEEHGRGTDHPHHLLPQAGGLHSPGSKGEERSHYSQSYGIHIRSSWPAYPEECLTPFCDVT